MSGRRIDDHSFWAGKGNDESVFPKGVHLKRESDDGHAGHLNNYEDTTEKIRTAQMMADKKVKGHPRKDFHRN